MCLRGMQTLKMHFGEMRNHTFVFCRFFQTVASCPERARFRVRVRFSANTENAPHFERSFVPALAAAAS